MHFGVPHKGPGSPGTGQTYKTFDEPEEITTSPSQGDPFGSVASLGYGGPEGALAGSTWETGWEQFFDPYDPTKERMLGQQYQTQLGGLFGEAGLGTQNLLQSWAGGGQTMTGRKGRQRGAIGKETVLGGTKLLQGYQQSVFGEQQDWEREQRRTLDTMLGWDIWGSDPYHARSLEIAEDIGKEWEEGDESRFTTL